MNITQFKFLELAIKQIHDGYDATTEEVLHSCGNTRPAPIVSSSNVIFIRLSASGSSYGGHDVSTIVHNHGHKLCS